MVSDPSVTGDVKPRRGRIALVGACLALLTWAPLSRADDVPGEVQITFMRDRPIFVRLQERVVNEGGREVRQQFFEIVQSGEVELTEAIVARWTTGHRSFDDLRKEGSSRLNEVLTLIRTTVPVSAAQLHKLSTAGQGDVSRFVADCEEVHISRQGRCVSWDEMQALAPRCQELKERFTGGLHRQESLLQKQLAVLLSQSDLERVLSVLADPAQKLNLFRPL